MPDVYADRVVQRTLTQGTGTITLGAHVRACVDFEDAVTDGATVRILIEDANLVDWEITGSTYNAGTLTRDTLIASSTGSRISLSAGLHFVSIVADAAILGLIPSALQAITGVMVVAALGYTPYSAANPSNYITSAGAPVQSVAGRTGAVTLTASDVAGTAWTQATLTDLDQLANGPGYLTGITSGQVAAALGYTPANAAALNASALLSGTVPAAVMSGANIVTALGYTPYNATNPSAYITSAGAPVQSVFGRTGSVVMAGADVNTALGYTAANAAALSASALTSGTVPAGAFPALTGDVTTIAGALATTLATVNSNVGAFGSATQSVALTVNAKGLVTAVAAQTITPAVGSITGLGTGVATWLATPTSANLAAAITNETGSGALVFATSPTLVTPVLGAASATTLAMSGALTLSGPASAGTSNYSMFLTPAEASAVSFTLVGASYTNAGDTRTNQVFRMGANAGASLIYDNANAGIFDTWESHYAPDTSRNVERHISYVPAGAGTETRLWTAAVNKSTSVANISSTADRWVWYKRSDGSVFMDLNQASASFVRSNFEIGASTAGASGFTLFVFNQLGTTNVVIKAGAVLGGNHFAIQNNAGAAKFYVDQSFDTYAVGALSAGTTLNVTSDAHASNWLTTGDAISLRNDGSLNIRNAAGSAGIYFASGTHEYDTKDVSLVRNAAGIIAVTDGSAGTGSAGKYRDVKVRNVLAAGGNGSYVQVPSMTVANLAAAATAGAGARAFVTDATATTFLSTVAGGGSNKVPVISDGTNWLIA